SSDVSHMHHEQPGVASPTQQLLRALSRGDTFWQVKFAAEELLLEVDQQQSGSCAGQLGRTSGSIDRSERGRLIGHRRRAIGRENREAKEPGCQQWDYEWRESHIASSRRGSNDTTRPLAAPSRQLAAGEWGLGPLAAPSRQLAAGEWGLG